MANTPNGSTKYTLELSLDSILVVIKAVNDSLHTPNIKSLPEVLQPLGSLICQETFTVTTENKSQSQLLFRLANCLISHVNLKLLLSHQEKCPETPHLAI